MKTVEDSVGRARFRLDNPFGWFIIHQPCQHWFWRFLPRCFVGKYSRCSVYVYDPRKILEFPHVSHYHQYSTDRDSNLLNSMRLPDFCWSSGDTNAQPGKLLQNHTGKISESGWKLKQRQKSSAKSYWWRVSVTIYFIQTRWSSRYIAFKIAHVRVWKAKVS